MPENTRTPLSWVVAALLLVTAAVHVPLISDHLQEAPYVGVLFIALAVVCVVLAVAVLVLHESPMTWELSGVVTLLALVAFLASRTVGLPQLGDDVGNWSDPLGLPAIAAELLTTLIVAYALRQHSTLQRKGMS